MKTSTLDNKEALLTAIFAALEAGAAVLEVYQSDFAIKQKDDTSPLTLADERSHDIITRRLSQSIAFSLPVLSEEGRDIPYRTRKKWEYCWLVDPLDGTKEFIKRNGEFTINIALVRKGISILGVIYVPVKGVFYFAAEDIGSYKLDDGEMMKKLCAVQNYGKKGKAFSTDHLLHAIIDSSIRLSSNGSDHDFTIIASRSHCSQETEEFIATLKTKHHDVKTISAGSSLKFCLLAEGKADVYPRFGPTMEWDTAAGQAIVEQAGGDVVDYKNYKPLLYNKEDLLNPWFIGFSRKLDLYIL